MSWKHGEPLEEAADSAAPVPANPLVNSSREAPAIHIFGSPSPVESDYRQASGTINTSQQGPSTDIDTVRLENGDAKLSPSALNSPRLRTGKQVLRPSTRQASRPSRKKPFQNDRQPQLAANVSLGLVYSPKVSKKAVQKGPRP
jgi:hypothetical protein